MHSIKITLNLLFEYQCTSGKFIRLPNRIESNRNFFCPNWNALAPMRCDNFTFPKYRQSRGRSSNSGAVDVRPYETRCRYSPPVHKQCIVRRSSSNLQVGRTTAVDERSDVSFSIPRGMLPCQPFFSLYPQN